MSGRKRGGEERDESTDQSINGKREKEREEREWEWQITRVLIR